MATKPVKHVGPGQVTTYTVTISEEKFQESYPRAEKVYQA
jgi:hypothetical protein